MDVDEHIRYLQREGDLLGDAITGVDPDSAVPTCPEWNVRDLVRHLGGIHRWAAGVVGDQQSQPIDQPLEQLAGGWPEDAALVDWFRAGHTALVRTLTNADPDVDCWAFLPAPSPLAFWARRQANETAVHRADAQSVRGAITPIAADHAADAIDEILTGFGRRRYEFGNEPRHLQLRAVDLGRAWLVELGERAEVQEHADGWISDCTVDGTASDLLLLLWNRIAADAETLAIAGNPESLTRWREVVLIRWTE